MGESGITQKTTKKKKKEYYERKQLSALRENLGRDLI